MTIDDQQVGLFSAEDLAHGSNLANYHTPMRDQAQRVSWSIADRVKAAEVHMTMLIQKANLGPIGGQGDALETFENSLEDKIYAAAAPVPHRFTLSPVVISQSHESIPK